MHLSSPKRVEDRPNAPASKAPEEGRNPRKPELRRPEPTPEVDHEGATEDETGDRTGPGAGYDQEPEKERNKGGVET